MKKKLGINTATGIINIIIGCLGLAAFYVLMQAVELMSIYGDDIELEYYLEPSMLMLYALAWLATIVSIIMSIISIVQSKKHGISMVGPILGLCGSAGSLFLACGLSIVTGPLTIAGGIVGLIQKNVRGYQCQTEEYVPMPSQMPVERPVDRRVDEPIRVINNPLGQDNSNVTVGKEDEWNL